MQSMSKDPELHLFCGKMAAGKSTLAIELAKKLDAILIVEDHWLENLYPDEITDVSSYIKYSARLNNIISKHVINLLNNGTTVILDFPANTIQQRKSSQSIIKTSNISHTLHYINTSDETCKKQLKKRSKNKPEGSAFTTDIEFDKITRYFQQPTKTEGFNIKEYK